MNDSSDSMEASRRPERSPSFLPAPDSMDDFFDFKAASKGGKGKSRE